MLEAKRITNLRVSIIIPCYNRVEFLKKNLPKVLEAASYKGNLIHEVILVDDASSDKSATIVEQQFPKVKVIHHRISRGFSASVNTGARSAKGNILVLLNTDMAPEKNFLVSALKRFKNPKVFAVSLRGKVGESWIKGSFKDGFAKYEEGIDDKKIHDTFVVPGESSVYRRDYWMALGGMDEKLFSPFYWEDVDLSYRAAKRGLINQWDPSIVISHKHDDANFKEFPKLYIQRIQERNKIIFVWKNISSPIMFRKHLMSLAQKVVTNPRYIRIVLMALTRLKALIRLRKKEIKESRLSDEAVFAKFS